MVAVSRTVILLVVPACLAFFGGTRASAEAAQPGPYEILPAAETYIVEAYKDLLDGDQNADWTGWLSSDYLTPHPYNRHNGTDFSLQTGTDVYAVGDGQVSAVVNDIPLNKHVGYLGNHVRLALDAPSPEGQKVDLVIAHMAPGSPVKVGQRLRTGDLIGQSDNTGRSDSEHMHFQAMLRDGTVVCPFYYGLFRYPIVFNPNAQTQLGHIVKILASSTPVRAERMESSAVIATAFQGQLFYAPYWQRGYYRIFVPNDSSNRGGWVKATEVTEVLEGGVLQALPDRGPYVPSAKLASPYPIRATANDSAQQIGQICWGGGRFVADQNQADWYRIAVPGAAASWGWVRVNPRMIVYPQLYHPRVNLANMPKNTFPIRESFAVDGRSFFGRPKFNRPVVAPFNVPSPGGDGHALFLTDATIKGSSTHNAISIGRPEYRNYYVQVDCYFNYRPEYGGWERYGVFLRDDGWAGLDQDYEGLGNAYSILYDSNTGRVQAAKVVDSAVQDLLTTQANVKASGWHRLRIESYEDQIAFLIDGVKLVQVTDATFPSGPCGIWYNWHQERSAEPTRGAWFDNFEADLLQPVRR